MTENVKLRRPAPGEPLAVIVMAGDLLARDALTTRLGRQNGIKIVKAAGDAHVALLDPGVSPGENRQSRAKLDASLAPLADLPIPAVVLAEDETQARAALARGARGAVLRKPDGPRLVAALTAVASGLTVIDFSLAMPVVEAEDGQPLQLTTREQEVMELLAIGCSNRRIARRLGISEHTAKFHVNGILVKLGAGTRTEAVIIAARRGLVTL